MSYKIDTLLAHLGSHPREHHGTVNPPVYHASTITFPTMAEFEAAREHRFEGKVSYGRFGTPTTFAFEEAVAHLEGGERAFALPSGLAAVAVALGGLLEAGDHLLMVDSVYHPARRFCTTVLPRFGVETTFYDPLLGADIEALLRPETKVIYTESPGSHTFEVQDIPAIADVAHAHGATVLMDNTWATPLFFAPFEHGVDVSIQAATKYLVGHSDAMLGTLTGNEALYAKLRDFAAAMGYSVAPDDIYLGLRGMRTLAVRLERHQQNALRVAGWLQRCPEVRQVLHPALPDTSGHDLWRRDFRGATGLFGVELEPCSKAAVEAMLASLELFGIGASWGGYESLIMATHPERNVHPERWETGGPTLRLHIGLEDPDDLRADLEQGLQRLSQHD